MNVAQHIERGRHDCPERVALSFEGRAYTYAELEAWASRTANALTKLGCVRGTRVALFLPNIPEFVAAYLGAAKIGAIVVSVNALFKRDEVAHVLNDSEASVLITTGELYPIFAEIQTTRVQHVIIAAGPHRGRANLADLCAQAEPHAPALTMDPSDPVALVYTSGTTGFPKGATLSHGNVVFNSRSKVQYCGMRPEDRLLLFLPLFHCFGQNAVLNSGFEAQATVVLQRRFEPELALRALLEEQITMFFGVPTVFILLLTRPGTQAALRTVRYCLSGGAPLPAEVAHQWYDRYQLYINIGYGLTETSPFASYNHATQYRFGSVGTPIAEVAMRVVNPETRVEVPPGELGEIAICGPNVMLGYWKRPEETAQVLQDGWFYSGDIGQMDAEGYFFVVDRLKDMINVAGLKVYPAEVENVLYGHPGVAEVAVYGRPDAVTGEGVAAAVVLRGAATLTDAELIAFCRTRLASYKVPTDIQFVEALPKNAPGKILKRTLRQNAGASTQGA